MKELKNGEKKIQKKQKNNGVASIKHTPKRLKEKRENSTKSEKSFWKSSSIAQITEVLKRVTEDAYEFGYEAGKRRILFLISFYLVIISVGLLVGSLTARLVF